MIDLIKKFIPWSNSLAKHRTIIDFWLNSSPGSLATDVVRKAIEENLSNFLKDGGECGKGDIIRSGYELFEDLNLTESNSPGYSLKFSVPGAKYIKNLSIATGKDRDFDAIILRGKITDFSFQNAESIILSLQSSRFHSSTLVDTDYHELQQQVHRNRYRFTGGLIEDKKWNDKNRVDIRGRPGLNASIPLNHGTLETGAAHFWFGDLIYEAIPKERILSFDRAHEIKELPNGIIYVNLYEGTFNGNLPENQAKQEAFKEHLGLIQDY